MPLVINSFWGGDTHTHTHARTHREVQTDRQTARHTQADTDTHARTPIPTSTQPSGRTDTMFKKPDSRLV